MTASFPGSLKSFTQQVAGVSEMNAADVNEAYDEIEAMQAAMIRMLFGDGGDGDVTINADTDLSDLPKHYNNLTINAAKTLSVIIGGTVYAPVIYVKGTLTINGTLAINGADGNNGNPNSGATGGTGGDAGSGNIVGHGQSLAGLSGGLGGDTTVNGANGTEIPADTFDLLFVTAQNDTPLDGASGGDGAVGTGGVGSAGGSEYVPVSPDYTTAAQMLKLGFSTGDLLGSMFIGNSINGGAGGGGGGATAGGGGGGGGGGHAGTLSIIARNIVIGAAGRIEAIGGDGGDGGASDGDGGGGGAGAGGNGGVIVLCYYKLTNAGTIDVSGGAGGTGGTSVSADPGGNGPDGYDGIVIEI